MASKLPVKRRRRVQQVKCIAYANRSRRRLFTAEKIGAIVCHFLIAASGEVRAGGQIVQVGSNPITAKANLRRELDRCFPCFEDERTNVKAQESAILARAASALQDTNLVIAVALAVLLALVVLPKIVPFIPALALRLLPAGALVALRLIPNAIARLQSRQAANDALWRMIVGLR